MDPFLGEIRAFTWAFAPRGWALCNGALLPVRQNTALFALLGTYYGGDGTNTFGIPDLRGRTMVDAGIGPDGINYPIGGAGGAETVALTTPAIPQHNHILAAYQEDADKAVLANNYVLAKAHKASGTPANIYGPYANVVALAPGSIATAGSGTAHANVQPSLVLNFCIALSGIFPSRS
jgi:microcystin-dependent protein